MVEVKYLFVLLILIAVGYFGYSLLLKTSGGFLSETECKQLLLKHDPSISGMSFFTSGSDYHIDGSNGSAVMKYNFSTDKSVIFLSSDDFEGCSITTNSLDILKGDYKEYLCSKEGVSKFFVETKESESYFFVNYKIISNLETFGKIIYASTAIPQFKILIEKSLAEMVDLYGCE